MRGAVAGAGGGAGAVDRREGSAGPGVRPDGRPGRPDRPGAPPGRITESHSCGRSTTSVMFQEFGPLRDDLETMGTLLFSSWCAPCQADFRAAHHGAFPGFLGAAHFGAARVAARLDRSLYQWQTNHLQSCRTVSCLLKSRPAKASWLLERQ